LRDLADTADIHVIVPRACAYRPPAPLRTHLVSARPLRFWTQVAFPLIIKRLRPAAVFCLGQNLPWWRPAARYAVVINDVGPLEDLGWPTSSHDPYNRAWLKREAPSADALVAVSAFTKARLMALLGYPAERISVAHPIYPTWEPPRLPDPGSHPPGDYFLSLGNLEPRKNFPGLIAAYARLRGKWPDAPPLYIVGQAAWGFRETVAAIARYGLEDRVRLTGYLSDADRQAHLDHCLVYIASSLYEGWGLPLFEALTAGKPALYHAGSSQEEFARGSAMAVDCGDPAALAVALETLWRDAGARERLARGRMENFPGMLRYDLPAALRAALLPLL
jgi:glycosyltransferase involved in cell wall biosynthesis